MKENTTEWAVLGGLIHEPSRYSEIEISADDFEQETHQQIFEAIKDMTIAGEPIDVITLSDHLGRGNNRKWLPVVGQIAKNTMGARNIATYARLLKESATKRKAADIAIKLINDLKNDTGTVDEAVQKFLELGQTNKIHECNLSETLSSALDTIDKIHNSGGLPGITTGLRDLDSMLGGFRETDLVTIAGRPAMGKTAFALNCIEAADVPCGFMSSEQPRDQIGMRLISINGKIASSKLRNANLKDEDWRDVTNTVSRMHEKKIFINDKPSITLNDITRQARKWKYNHGIGILFVDYLQRIKGDKRLPRHEQINEIAGGLKTLARELKIPVVVLAQVNRDVEKRPNKRPYMSDLKDSGGIEQESDIALALYRDEVYNNETEHPNTCEIGVLKNRGGPVSTVYVQWAGEFLKFEDRAYG